MFYFFYLNMRYFLRHYPFSIALILVVSYLSFFKPPSLDDEPLFMFPHFDKVVHCCMYFGMSGVLWIEFIRAHSRQKAPLWHAWVGAVACPVCFSGIVELLQSYCTTYRGGDWLDLAANTTGVALATALALLHIRYGESKQQ